MKPIEPIETHDFDAGTFPQMRITIHPSMEDGKDIVMVNIIDFKTLVYSMKGGQFVDIAPCIVKHLYVHPRLGEHSPSMTTIVPHGSFRIAKFAMVNDHTTRICIIPPKALDGKIKKVVPFVRIPDVIDIIKDPVLPKPEKGDTQIFATINNNHYIVDVPTVFVSEIKQNNDIIDKDIFFKLSNYRAKLPILLQDEPDMMTGWDIDTSMDKAFVKAFFEDFEEGEKNE